MSYKITIVLVWLALPLAALLLLRADYERYQQELESQLLYAESRKDLLAKYSRLYDDSAHEIQLISDPQSRMYWETEYSDLHHQQQSEEDQLGNPSLSHYPMARKVLEDAADELEQQRRYIRDAARLQDAYAKADAGFGELQEQLWFMAGMAERARSLGAFEIYMRYQDAIARLEDQFRRRQRQRMEIDSELTLTMGQANSHSSEMRRMLASLPDKLALDHGRSYREDLAQRFENFDLRAQIKQIVVGKPAQAAQSK